ncbi:hypothetical protein [Flavobacterium sp.]|uniref:hypothetical protein n=2 Tax=Flavobacterium sp. TaxID=239 RepID=UPI00404886FB
MEVNNVHIEKQLEKILKPNIEWFVRIKKFKINDIYIDELDINYFNDEIEVFKNFLFYFKAENLLNINTIKAIRSLFMKRLDLLDNDFNINNPKFIIKGIFFSSIDDFPLRQNKKVDLSTYLKTPDFNDVLQCGFHHHIFSSISEEEYKQLLKDNEHGEFIIQNLKLQYVLKLHYKSVKDYIKFLDYIIELDDNFKITDFKSLFAPNSNKINLSEKKKVILKMDNREVVLFFYLMHIYDIMSVNIDKKVSKKRVDLERFFEENFMYKDKNENPQNLVRLGSQLSKINSPNFESAKMDFIKKWIDLLNDFGEGTVNKKLSNLK